MQLSQQYQWNDDEFFIPAGYRIFKVKSSLLANRHIQRRSLIYASDAMTVRNLIDIFLQDYNLSEQRFGENMVVGFHLEGVGKLAMETSIFQIKNTLHNQKITVLEFTPFLTDKITFNYECSAVLKITTHPLSKQIQANQNKVEFCLDFTQFQEVEYAFFNASNLIGFQLLKFLKSKQRNYGKDLSLLTYKIVCQGCGEEISAETQVFMLRHYSLQVTFKQLTQSNKKPFLHDVLVNLIEGVDRVVRTVSFGSIMRKKVRTVLEESRLAIESIECFGLRILNTILKPIDFLSKLQMQLGVMSKVTINAFLVQQSQLFYSIQPLFQDISFDISEITNTLKSQEVRRNKEKMLSQIYVRREERINSSPLPIHKSNRFIDPILGYTSELYYRQLNLYLRQTNFGMVSEEDYMKYEYKFSFALINSLLKLPNFSGKVYRGVQFSDIKSKKGHIISFNSFTSTSYNRERAQKFGKRTFYIIDSLIGKDVSSYSYFKDQQEVLFMPYTYFYVTSVEIDTNTEFGTIVISLQEIPVPRRTDSNLLFWVDDDLNQSSKIYAALLYKMPNIKTEIIQLSSNEHLKIWVRKFGYILKKKLKINLITDMRRGEQTDAGLTTISILSKHVKNLNTFIYIFNLSKTKELLESRGIQLSSSLQIGHQRTEATRFIQTKVLDESQMASQQCQLI